MTKKIWVGMLITMFLCAALGAVQPAKAAGEELSAGKVATAGGSLNVRATASLSASRVGQLASGSLVTLIDKSGSWWHVRYGRNSYGYVSANYIDQVSGDYAAKVQVASGSLSVRTGAGTSYPRVNLLAKGETVVVLSAADGWSRILYYGTKIGYASSAYLQRETDAISLSVPSYKQTDSRWSDVELGSSGRTIGGSGCTTTCLAMTESYRTGTTIDPAMMEKRLKYTSTGALYWPSNYSFYTGSAYLNTILQELKDGIPVIIGSKNSSGGSHYVVVTGFSGGSVAAANFTINDPGSSSRSTLAQFLSAYPNFYKLAYYN